MPETADAAETALTGEFDLDLLCCFRASGSSGEGAEAEDDPAECAADADEDAAAAIDEVSDEAGAAVTCCCCCSVSGD